MQVEDEKKSQESSTQWTTIEQIRYSLFITLNLDSFVRPRKKNEHIFLEMEKFIGSRNALQCKSHHQKKKIKTKEDVYQLLWRFIEDEYEARWINYDHSTYELEHCLSNESRKYLTDKNKTDLIQKFKENWKKVLDAKDVYQSIEEKGESIQVQPGQSSRTRENEDIFLPSYYQPEEEEYQCDLMKWMEQIS